MSLGMQFLFILKGVESNNMEIDGYVLNGIYYQAEKTIVVGIHDDVYLATEKQVDEYLDGVNNKLKTA